MESCVYATTSSLLGPLWICATAVGVCGLGFGEYPSDAEVRRMARYVLVRLATILLTIFGGVFATILLAVLSAGPADAGRRARPAARRG